MSKPFYSDPVFWATSAMAPSVMTMGNYASFNRITYRWYRMVPVAFFTGFFFHLMINIRRSHFVANYQLDDLQAEAARLETVAVKKGRFLEQDEQRIKEAFKTIVF